MAVPHYDGLAESGWSCSKHQMGTAMEHYAGIDVSLESSSVCVVDGTGRVVREAKVALARKLAVVLHQMLVSGTAFNPTLAAAARA